MKKILKQSSTLIVSLIFFIVTVQLAAQSLSTFQFNGAGVLPYTTWKSKPGKKYILLSREASGTDKGTWDSFGGSRDPQENHPMITAGREFAEETAYSIMTAKKAQSYIDVDAGFSKVVIAHQNKRYVLYITYLQENLMKKLRNNFYDAIKKSKQGKLKEKDAIAFVNYNNLEKAIINASCTAQGRLNPVTVLAQVIDNKGKSHTQSIRLRPILVRVLQPYFENKPYIQGKHKAIRFY